MCHNQATTCMAVTLRSLAPAPPELKGTVSSSLGVAAATSQARTRPSALHHLSEHRLQLCWLSLPYHQYGLGGGFRC